MDAGVKFLLIVIIVLLSVVLLAFIASLAVSYIAGKMIANMIMKAYQKPFEKQKESDIKYGFGDAYEDYDNLWERHPFTLERPGATLSCEYVVNKESTGGRKKVAIICHGHTVLRAADFKYGKMFYKMGYNLIFFDERYFGESTGEYCTLGMLESEDIAALIKEARRIFGKDAFIATHGESMGAASELLALAYEKPDLVVADCPFADTEMLVLNLAKKSVGPFAPYATLFARRIGIKRADYDLAKVNPIEAVKETDVPVCFIHGADDNYIPCGHSKGMYESCKNEDSELHLIPGADHAMSVAVDKAAYEKILRDFVTKIEKKADLN
ncbi:MAG: alpha/beta hydrolase [Lachnospiraceae bacterium]|nr:alpha/beta hydrolase [Lachnospiraceae bacterium]